MKFGKWNFIVREVEGRGIDIMIGYKEGEGDRILGRRKLGI